MDPNRFCRSASRTYAPVTSCVTCDCCDVSQDIWPSALQLLSRLPTKNTPPNLNSKPKALHLASSTAPLLAFASTQPDATGADPKRQAFWMASTVQGMGIWKCSGRPFSFRTDAMA